MRKSSWKAAVLVASGLCVFGLAVGCGSGASGTATGKSSSTGTTGSGSTGTGSGTTTGTTGTTTGTGTGSGTTTGTTGTTTGSGSTGGGQPSIAISTPAVNQVVALGGDSAKSVPVQFAVQNFTLMAPGSNNCPAGSCGHIHLLIDGTACNAGGAPYDSAAAASPAMAQFASCPASSLVPGSAHTIRLELHNNDHSPVIGASGAVIAAEETVVLGPVTGGSPGITLDAIGPGAAVTLGSDSHRSLSVGFTVSNFDLSPPGTCPSQSAGACGHVHLLIDGAACTPPGAPYDNAAVASPAAAYFATCTAPAGSHTVTLELHNDDHSPVQEGGATVAASVPVVAR